MKPNEIYIILRRARKNKHISQAELARRIDIKQAYISAVEEGKTNITLKTLQKFCKELDIEFKLMAKGRKKWL